jgi:hypothetical protein
VLEIRFEIGLRLRLRLGLGLELGLGLGLETYLTRDMSPAKPLTTVLNQPVRDQGQKP